MPLLFFYDTRTGAFLDLAEKSSDAVEVVSGSGVLSGSVLESDDLEGIDVSSIIRLILVLPSGRHVGFLKLKRLSDTSIDISRAIADEVLNVTFVGQGTSPSPMYTSNEKAQLLASVKTAVGHDFVDFVAIKKVKSALSPSKWKIDLVTKKMVEIDDDFEYE